MWERNGFQVYQTSELHHCTYVWLQDFLSQQMDKKLYTQKKESASFAYCHWMFSYNVCLCMWWGEECASSIPIPIKVLPPLNNILFYSRLRKNKNAMNKIQFHWVLSFQQISLAYIAFSISKVFSFKTSMCSVSSWIWKYS